MLTGRTLVRLSANARPFAVPRAQAQFSTSRLLRAESSAASTARNALSSTTSITLAAGAAGGFVAYGLWYLSPAGQAARKINSAAYTAKKYYDDAAKTLQAKTPTTDQALDALKAYARSYFSWIPGGGAAVDAAFRDIDRIREKHGQEIDQLVQETYGELQGISKSGVSIESANKVVAALNTFQHRLLSLAGGSFAEILDNHPQLKDKIGRPVEDLKKMGETMGPEVKKQVDQTWDQLQDIMKGGLSTVTIYKARNLIQEKSDMIKNMGGESWNKALEQARPMLEKSPKVKELLEKNASALQQGNVKEIFEKVSSAVKSGSTGDLEQYVQSALQSASSSGMANFEHYAGMIPGGIEILPRLSQIKDVAENHREDGEKLLKETIAEIRKVVEKQAGKAQNILDKAGK